jgi:hypothetical protein
MAYLRSVDVDANAPIDRAGAMTTVGRYVQKQLAWAEAQGQLVGAKAQALGNKLRYLLRHENSD